MFFMYLFVQDGLKILHLI